MPYSQRSRRSHEESQQTKRAEDRVWMEQLEGRVLLNGAPDAQALDLSVVNHLVGTTPALYRIDVPAGQKYLILDLEGQDQVHLLDAQQREIKVLEPEDDDNNSRAVLAPQTSSTYYFSLQEGWGVNAFDIIVRQAHDDFGDRPATAPLLTEGQVISGEIEDFPDKDLFRFNAVAGERYVFDGVTNDLSLRILNTRGHQAINCTDGCEPMPYTGTYYIEISGDDW